MNLSRSIEDVLDIEELQKIQDDLSRAFDMAFVTVNYKGEPVTVFSGITRFCEAVMKNTELCDQCAHCHAHAGLHAVLAGAPHMYLCHTGLFSCAVPLEVEGVYYGAVLGGQLNPGDEGVKGVECIVAHESDWKDYSELARERDSIRRLNRSRVESVLNVLRLSVISLLRTGQIEKLSRTLENCEKENEELKEREKFVSPSRQGTVRSVRELYMHLNTISNLSYLEGSEQTMRAVVSLAEMTRYMGEYPYGSVSRLGDEIANVENYLWLESHRLEGKLKYEINFPQSCGNVMCPAMIVKNVVQYDIEYSVESIEEGGQIIINVASERDDLMLTVQCLGRTISNEIIDNITNDRERLFEGQSGYNLYKVNKTLTLLMGRKHSLIVENLPNGAGTSVRIRLPSDNRFMKGSE